MFVGENHICFYANILSTKTKVIYKIYLKYLKFIVSNKDQWYNFDWKKKSLRVNRKCYRNLN